METCGWMPFMMLTLINSTVTLDVFTRVTISLMTKTSDLGTRQTKTKFLIQKSEYTIPFR